MSEAIRGLDAAVVFDFGAGNPVAAARTEARALFFLAAWRQHVAGQVSLHIVCVGDPPDTVLALAEYSAMAVTRQPPFVLANGTVFNRALAWMAPGDSDRRLALSHEVLVLGNFLPALAVLPVDCLAAAPAEKAQVPEAAWALVYRSLDLPLPTGRMRPLRAELDLPAAGAGEMLPCYHGAALLAPRACELGQLWAAHFLRLGAMLPDLKNLSPGLGAKLARNGNVALTTACQAILGQGDRTYRRLPPACDGRLPYFESASGAGTVRLLHASNLFGGLFDLSQVQDHLHAYTARLRTAVADGVRRRGGGAARARLTAAWRSQPVEAALRRLYLQEVRPAMRRCGAYG